MDGPETFENLARYLRQGFVTLDRTNSAGEARRVLVGFARDDYGGLDLLVFYENDSGAFRGTSQSVTKMANLVAGGFGEISLDSAGRVSGTSSFTLSDGLGGSFSLDLGGLQFLSSATANSSAIDYTGVETSDRALVALDVLSNRLDELASYRGTIGALQSRVNVALSLAQVNAETRKAAESRIRDADIGMEGARLAQLQILQQAGAAVLAQANNLPALALTLLR